MTFSRSATLPVGLTAFTMRPNANGPTVLRFNIAQGNVADLSAEDAVALAEYILQKFPEERRLSTE